MDGSIYEEFIEFTDILDVIIYEYVTTCHVKQILGLLIKNKPEIYILFPDFELKSNDLYCAYKNIKELINK